MRLGCTVSTYETAFGPIVWRDGNLAHDFQIMRKYGYDGVDLFVKDTSDREIAEYRSLTKAFGMKVTTLFAIFLGEQGVCLSETDTYIRKRNADLVKRQMEKAAMLGAESLGLGFIRGPYGKGETEADALARIAIAVKEIGAYAKKLGISVLLEPINRYEINTLNRAVDAADFIRNHELTGVKLLLDMFHMNIEDRSIPDAIRYAGDLLGNLHVSSSGRYAVGEGHLDYRSAIQALNEIEYEGCLTLEAYAPDPEEALRKTAQYLSELTAFTAVSDSGA